MGYILKLRGVKIGTAHRILLITRRGLPNINMQISNFSNFFESKQWFIFIYEHIQLLNHILQI